MALGIDGLRIGTWTAPGEASGCTVVLPPPNTVGAIAVRGAAPGTREAAALSAMGKVSVCHAVVLAGGSAFGLAAADGVVEVLEAAGQGYPVGPARVPIVGAAIVLDMAVLDPKMRPNAAAGKAAAQAATTADPAEGSVGVGAGCTIAKVAGIEHAWRGGQGIAVHRAGEVVVGAIVANNAVGELVGETGWIARARVPDDTPRWPYDGSDGIPMPTDTDGISMPADPDAADVAEAQVAEAEAADIDAAGSRSSGPATTDEHSQNGPSANTVIGVVVTNARLSKRDAVRVADLAHSGTARAVRPAHTEADGDALFCLATGTVETNVDVVAALAADAVAEALRRGPQAATSNPGAPGLADQPGREVR